MRRYFVIVDEQLEVQSLKTRTMDAERQTPSHPAVIRIEPSRGWVSLRLHEVWEYRELLYFLSLARRQSALQADPPGCRLGHHSTLFYDGGL